MTDSFELSFTARSEHVALARLFTVAVAAGRPWIDGQRLEDIRLMVSEAVTNAVQAQRQADPHAEVVIRCSVDDDRFEVVVADRAGGFDPVPATLEAPPDLDREGGFGLPLMETLADEAHFDASGHGTEVRLVVHRSV